MGKRYFLHLNTVNLSQYFTRGLILPSKFIEGWIYDIQSNYKEGLLFFYQPLTVRTECSLEIVLTNEEKNDLISISDEVHLFTKPLPISRIKNIYFTNETQSKNSVYNIESGNAFVPKELVKIIDKKEALEFPNINKNESYLKDYNWAIKNKLFNKILGGFALMQIAKTDDFKNYSDNYFKYLSFINKQVEKDSSIANNKVDEKYLNFLNIEDDKPKSKVYERITIDLVKEKATKENIKTRRGNIQYIESINDPNLYNLAILATYGNDIGKTKKIDEFIYAVVNKTFKQDHLEILCLTFGINQGYTVFNNKYHIKGENIEVKFKLNSELDYSIIESVYQYVFNGVKDNYSFNYLNTWCPKYKNIVDIEKYETYKVFDKIIINKEIQSIEKDYLQEILDKLPLNNTINSLFKVLNEKVINTLKEIFNSNYKSIKSDFNKELVVLKNENIVLNEELKKIQLENKELNSKLKYAEINSDRNALKEGDESQTEIPLIVNNDEFSIRLKFLNKTTQIGHLKTLAGYVGIKSPNKYKKEDVEKLRDLIIEKERNILN